MTHDDHCGGLVGAARGGEHDFDSDPRSPCYAPGMANHGAWHPPDRRRTRAASGGALVAALEARGPADLANVDTAEAWPDRVVSEASP